MASNAPRCLICGQNTTHHSNYLLTCDECRRSWHHKCRQPPIADTELNRLFVSFLASGTGTRTLRWTCPKCTARRKAAPASSVSILEVDVISEPAPPPRNLLTVQPRATSEIVDLTEPQSSRASSVGIIELSPDPPPPTNLAEPHLSDPPTPASPAAVEHLAMDVDVERYQTPRLSDPPAPPQTPPLPRSPSPLEIKFRPMDIDSDVDKKPLFMLLNNLAVSDRPQSVSLVPAWLRERCESSNYMSMLDQYLEKQHTAKPLSRRKPANTRFTTNSREPFVVLPFTEV